MTDHHPHNDQNPTPYLQTLTLIALYLLVRTTGGHPEDASTLTALALPLLPIHH
ncbi:hypothetical protein [Streptomyces sp. NPDC007074]|uniref:hypothetical protein n=1 Tax=Streptomyces sp. NPDC007074 TaxID=3156764 RepID=UPI0033FC690D